MKKMSVYEAPKAEVIEMSLKSVVLTGSDGGPWGGQNGEPSGTY